MKRAAAFDAAFVRDNYGTFLGELVVAELGEEVGVEIRVAAPRAAEGA